MHLSVNSGYVWPVWSTGGTDRRLLGMEEAGSSYPALSLSKSSNREIR